MSQKPGNKYAILASNRMRSTIVVFVVAVLMSTATIFAAGLAQPAYAALTADDPSTSRAVSSSLQATAAKKTIWVITKVKVTDDDGNRTYAYGYTKNGLVKKIDDDTYTYDKKGRLLRCKYVYSDDSTETFKFTLDKKGRVTSLGKGLSIKYNSKGYCSKWLFAHGRMQRTYTFDKKGRLATAKGHGGSAIETVKAIKYNSRNHITSYKNTGEGTKTIKVANTYKNGRLVKQVKTNPDSTDTATLTYAYKKVSVPKSLVTKVKAQQKCIHFRNTIDSEILPSLEFMNK